ncbi:sodium:proton antiporter [Chromobacterium haemolyticum]|uniref:cation:proton antiporter n=1 Tax=Chromobacterium haemolyticum TaxID=394935 RepID=UPI00031A9D1F|nr:cation:proton antiporter [Chromobacterium haemolyticum]MDH0340236.1 cation:proton antiporter [Chromobacterium haemolyticum]OQS30920.1 sodium:proton antiporter [Chromobacterium haemolyticum]
MSLPWQTLALNPLAAFGVLLSLGVIGGQIAVRVARLPAIVGYVLTGLLIGPHSLRLLDEQLLQQASIFVHLALGIALFEAGRRVDLRWLRVERTLLLTTLFYCLLTLLGLFAALQLFGLGLAASLMLAALGVATSPVVTLEIVRESNADGQVSERLLVATALSNLLALPCFALALSYGHLSGNNGVESGILLPGWLTLASCALGLLAGLAAIQLNRWLGGRQRESQKVMLFGLIALVVGVADMLQVLPSLALLTAGLATRNLKHGHTVTERGIMSSAHIFTVAFFVAAGAQLAPQSLAQFWPVAVACLLLRTGVAVLIWWLAAGANGLPKRHGACLGLALNSWSGGTSLLMSLGAISLGAAAGNFSGVMMAILVVNELCAPVLTRLALKLAGETRPQE